MKRVAHLLRPGTALVAIVLGSLLAVVPTAAGSGSDGVVITSSIDGIAGTNGWYRGSSHGNYVVLHWTVTDPNHVITGTAGCEAAIKIAGPSDGTTRTCTATTDTGSTSVTTSTIKIDADPPAGLAAAATRAADANGWYNHAFGVTWQASDATSGIAGCSSLTYSGPDAGTGSIAGGCTDNAGNTSSSSFAFHYDATAPVLSGVSVDSRAESDMLHWKSTSPTDTAVIRRVARGARADRTVFRGAGASFSDKKIKADVEYRYIVRSFDQAGNASKEVSVVALPKVVTLGQAQYVPRAAEQPILRWSGVRGAEYYHVQLFRRGKRILAAWPRTPELTLRPTWKWQGRRYRLAPGRYRWYAWAGFGQRDAANYKLLGKADFVVAR
jgi:hypothetical protein